MREGTMDKPTAETKGQHDHTGDDGDGAAQDWEAMFEKAEETLKLLTAHIGRLRAHLVSKGYGHAAIKRILKGEDVR